MLLTRPTCTDAIMCTSNTHSSPVVHPHSPPPPPTLPSRHAPTLPSPCTSYVPSLALGPPNAHSPCALGLVLTLATSPQGRCAATTIRSHGMRVHAGRYASLPRLVTHLPTLLHPRPPDVHGPQRSVLSSSSPPRPTIMRMACRDHHALSWNESAHCSLCVVIPRCHLPAHALAPSSSRRAQACAPSVSSSPSDTHGPYTLASLDAHMRLSPVHRHQLICLHALTWHALVCPHPTQCAQVPSPSVHIT
jgi:hypothetical protein